MDAPGMNDADADQRDADEHAIHRRETASDRPGVAQPVPKRPVPVQPWNRIFVGMLVMFALLLGAWEWYWRDYGVTPSTRNTDGLWAIQRRRIDNGEGDGNIRSPIIIELIKYQSFICTKIGAAVRDRTQNIG